MLREALIKLSQQSQLQHFATHNPVAQSMALRFVAGETLDQAITAIREINARGMTATLDHLGENVGSREEAAAAANAYILMLQTISAAGVNCNASLKLTHMGMDLGFDVALDNARRVVMQAAETNNFVRVDMEHSDHVDRTLDLVEQLHSEYPCVGTVIQSYLYRSEADVERLIEDRIRVRLVKGAYLEPAEVAFQDKADVDANFVRLMKLLLDRGTYPAIATHDCAMIDAARDFARTQGISRDRFEFQMLYGIRRDLQAQLRHEGYNMRIYVPYGTEWYPYLMRRMAERPANLMFVLGNLGREAVASNKR